MQLNTLLSHCSITLRQYWKDASFRPCLDLLPTPRGMSEEVTEEVKEGVVEDVREPFLPSCSYENGVCGMRMEYVE